MGDVVDMGDYRPHLAVKGTDGVIHVMPVALVMDVVQGTKPLSIIPEPVIRAMLGDFLMDCQL
jgi:hypothetical protein